MAINAARVWISFEPKLYSDLIRRVCQSQQGIEVVDFDSQSLIKTANFQVSLDPKIDVVILPLDESGLPDINFLPPFLKNTKIIAFSPFGTYGLLRCPGELGWKKIVPFSLRQLLDEVKNGGQLVGLVPQHEI